MEVFLKGNEIEHTNILCLREKTEQEWINGGTEGVGQDRRGVQVETNNSKAFQKKSYRTGRQKTPRLACCMTCLKQEPLQCANMW